MTSQTFEADALSALRLAERGDFAVARRLSQVEGAPPTWVAGLRAQARLAGLDLGPTPDAIDLEGTAGSFAAAQLDRLALLSLRLGGLAARAHGSSTDDVDAARELVVLLGRLFGGDTAGVVETAQALGARAARDRLAAVVVESKAVEALALLETDLAQSLRAARQASRMAQAEGLPQPQYFANLVLARARRRTGHPHLALRILGALAQVTPPAWSEWLGWELLFAGSPEPVDTEATRTVTRLLQAARAGDRAAADDASATLRARFSAPSPFGRDVARLLEALAPGRDGVSSSGDAETAAWTRGEVEELPAGLGALAGAAGPRAWVARAPGAPALRLLGPGRALWEASVGAAVCLCSEERAAGRTGAVLASLLFAGDAGLPEPELFERVYGFPYVRELHARVLGVLLHRVRKEVDGVEIDRQDGVLRLSHRGPVCLPDPDASLQLEERLLRWVASEGRQDARGIARELGVPLRSAQAALQALVEEGALVRERDGRSFSYRVEDTTFQEPTRS